MLKRIALVVLLIVLGNSAAIAVELNKEQKRNRRLIRSIAMKYNVDADFCDAIGKVESDYRSGAYNDNTPKTRASHEDWISRGVMQTTLATGRKFNKSIVGTNDLYDPEKSIVAGVKYIRYLFKKYPLATFADIAQMYNLGETRYNKGIRNSDYVDKFMRAFSELKKIK